MGYRQYQYCEGKYSGYVQPVYRCCGAMGSGHSRLRVQPGDDDTGKVYHGGRRLAHPPGRRYGWRYWRQRPQRSRTAIRDRPARTGRNRPELVTSTSMEEVKDDVSTVDDSPTLEESLQELEATAVTPRKRKLANFFSTVGRSEKAPEVQESEAAQARLARATRGKAVKDGEELAVEEVKATPKASVPARTAPARPASPFKTKYLLGMVIYLFGAPFIGVYEQAFLQSNHLNTVLTTFSLFGGKVVISTSTLVFLATLLLLLVVLARFDF